MSDTLPRLGIAGTKPWQRDRLASWLAEWELELEMPAAEETVPGKAGPAADMWPAEDHAVEPPPASGQVRLMSPEVPVAFNRPLFLVILSDLGDGTLMAAPYGRFAEPAFPGELVTGREAPPLRILCLWNARAVDAKTLGKSWLVDEMSRREMDEASRVLSYLRNGTKLSAGIVRRMGPPLWHPADPRVEYRRREAAVMEDLAGGAGSHEINDRGALVYPVGGRSYSLAAEPRAKYETKRDQRPRRRIRKTREK